MNTTYLGNYDDDDHENEHLEEEEGNYDDDEEGEEIAGIREKIMIFVRTNMKITR